MRSMKMRALFLTALLGFAAVVACSESENGSTFPNELEVDASDRTPPGKECCTGLCFSDFRQSFAVDVDDARLRASKLAICRNGNCFETSLGEAVPDSGPTLGYVSMPDGGSYDQERADVLITKDDRTELTVSYTLARTSDYRDGDVYAVTLTDADGTVLHHRESAVTYDVMNYCCQLCAHATFDEPDGGGDVEDAGADADAEAGTLLP